MGERIGGGLGISFKGVKDRDFHRMDRSGAVGSRRSAYNALNFFDLYAKLPHDDLKEQFKKLPQKSAYALASRPGDLSVKLISLESI